MQERFTLKNGQTVLIRRAEEADAAALAAFFHACGGETDFLSFGAEDCPFDEERARQFILGATNASALYLALLDGEIVAELSLTVPPRKRFYHKLELGIALSKSVWRQGLGSRLMELALQHGKEHGIDSIFLTVSAENEAGIALYRRYGFREYGRYERQALINGVYSDALLMNLYLHEQHA